nr:PspC domain-containing protein [uncultured Anaerotignum sp.]
MEKKIYRSKTDKKISGVCGGFAEYFAIDATIVRLLWVLGTLLNLFIGVVAYIACIFVIPEEPDTIDADFEEKK